MCPLLLGASGALNVISVGAQVPLVELAQELQILLFFRKKHA